MKFAVLFPLLVIALGCTPQTSEQETRGEIAVRGTARVKAAPDTVAFSIGVHTKRSSVSDAFDSNAIRMNAVIDALAKAGIDSNEMETSYFNIDWIEARKNVSAGFRVTNNINVTRNATDDVGRILAEAVDAGATSLGTIHFYINDPSLLDTQGLQDALEDARKKAETLASSSNRTLGKVLSVSTVDSGSYRYSETSSRLRSLGYVSSPQVLPGEHESIFSVDVVFELE